MRISLHVTSIAYDITALYKSLIAHSNALKSLQREHKKLQEREKSLGDILNSLRSGYNPNYQDMAVLEAVRGWEFLAGLPHIGVEEDAIVESESADTESSIEEDSTPAVEKLPEGHWSAEKLETDLNGLFNSDYVSLLIEHEEHIRSPPSDSICKPFVPGAYKLLIFATVFDLSYYLPDSILPHYEDFKDNILTWLENLGIVRGVVDNSAGT